MIMKMCLASNKDIDEEIDSRLGTTNISSGNSNQGRCNLQKDPGKKSPMDHFFSPRMWRVFQVSPRMGYQIKPKREAVVENRRSGKMTHTIINDTYKKEARERACPLITKWMYEVVIPNNAVTYPRFQPMIEAIDQYGVGMKRPTLHEVRITNLKKELILKEEMMEDHAMEWKKN